MDLSQADEKLLKIFRTIIEVPSIPTVVEKLLELSQDVSPREFADLIATDQGLTAKVLRLANSAFFSSKAPTCSVRQAASLLGTRTLKNLVLSMSVMNLLNRHCEGFESRLFWRHSLCVALACEKMAEFSLPQATNELYVAGLLHDTGVALLVHHLTEEYSRVLREVRVEGRLLGDVEAELLGATHAELGYALASRWRLPTLVCECIRCHDMFESIENAPAARDTLAIEIVRFADVWADENGFSFLTAESAGAGEQTPAPDWFPAGPEEFRGLLQDLAHQVLEREEIFCRTGIGPFSKVSPG